MEKCLKPEEQKSSKETSNKLQYQLQALKNKLSDDHGGKIFLLQRLQIIREYVNIVLEMEIQCAFSDCYDVKSAAEKRHELDVKRHERHNDAMMAVNRLNRLCQQYNLPILYTGDTEDRRAVGDFCLEMMRSFYDGR